MTARLYVLACTLTAEAILVLAACHVEPLPLTPEQRREWSPEYGATDYPSDPMAGVPRDAGRDR